MAKLFRLFAMFFGIGIFSAVSGCGYSRTQVLPHDIKTIYVDVVKNKIELKDVYAYQPGLEMSITNAIIRRLNRDGNLRVVQSRENADAILKADLTRFEQEGLRFSSLERVEEYKLYIVLDLRLYKAPEESLIWQEAEFSGNSEYFVSGVRSIARQEATERAIEDLAVNVVDRIVEDW